MVRMYDLSYYPMLSKNKSKCAKASVLCTTEDNNMYSQHNLLSSAVHKKILKNEYN